MLPSWSLLHWFIKADYNHSSILTFNYAILLLWKTTKNEKCYSINSTAFSNRFSCFTGYAKCRIQSFLCCLCLEWMWLIWGCNIEKTNKLEILISSGFCICMIDQLNQNQFMHETAVRVLPHLIQWFHSSKWGSLCKRKTPYVWEIISFLQWKSLHLMEGNHWIQATALCIWIFGNKTQESWESIWKGVKRTEPALNLFQ